MLVGQIRWSHKIKAQRRCYAPLLIGVFLLIFDSNSFGQILTSDGTVQEKVHGGIAIDSEGIKAAVIRVNGSEQGPGAEVVYTKVNYSTPTKAKNGRFAPEVIKATGQAVQKLYTDIKQQYKIPSQQIYIIGSSDLKADNLEELSAEVKSTTGNTITYLSLETEVRLSIIGTIPRRFREGTTWFNNRSHSVLIDIGSGQTIGGYQQIRQPLLGDPYYDFVVVGIPHGIMTFTNEVNQAAGEDADIKKFAASARMLSERTTRTALRNELERKPGLAHRKKIYLGGTIVWAMVTLLYPEDRQPLIPITVDDINIFHQQAVNTPKDLMNPDLSQIRDAEIRREVERDLGVIKRKFTPKSLIAGAEILKAIASEYKFQGEDKKILFARFGDLSAILSYVRIQAENGPQP